VTAAEPEPDPLGELDAAIAGSGLVQPGSSGVVLVSGGPDSACLAAGLCGHLGPEHLVALHLNYGLRAEADSDQERAAELCRRLGLELVTGRAGHPAGNLQEWARDLRYGRAEELRAERSADWVAAGHTRSDRVETAIYRLAVSPGTRPLLGLRASRNRVIRPLLSLGRDDLRRIALAAGLPFSDDRSNENLAFARARVRQVVLPAMRELNPAAERNVARTLDELAEDEQLLEQLAAAELPGPAIEAVRLEALHPALRRRTLRLLAERELGRPVPVPGATAAEVLRLGIHPEGGRVDAGGGAFFVARSGRITVEPPPGE